MKKVLLATLVGVSFLSGIAVAEPVRDWHDMDKVHTHVVEAIHEMERVAAANHYDMGGHAAKAEHDLRQAEIELGKAVESARHSQ